MRNSLVIMATAVFVMSASQSFSAQATSGAKSESRRPIWEFVPDTLGNDLDRRVCAGDVDGDGYSDLVVGEPAFDSNRGRVLIFFGGKAGLGPQPDKLIQGEPNEQFGSIVQFLGDLNG